MRRLVPLLFAVLLVVATVPGIAAAESRTGGTITVGPDETVDGDLEAFGGTVVVEGTVRGDVEAVAGTVVIDGTVEGDVDASGGTVEIGGTVDGDVNAAGGTVDVGESARIGGALNAGGGSVRVDGTVGEDANLGADQIRLGPTASIAGDLTYDGELNRAEGSTVGGSVTQSDDVGTGSPGPGFDLPSGTFTVYGVLVNLLAGAVLLVAFPRFSTRVADEVTDDPIRSGGVGVFALVGIPVLLVILLITVVGIPLSIAGLVAYLVLVWAGALYGRYALGRVALAQFDRESRWLALLVGVLAVALFKLVPVLGELVEAALVLLGLGALVYTLRDRYRSDEGEVEPAPDAVGGDAEPA